MINPIGSALPARIRALADGSRREIEVALLQVLESRVVQLVRYFHFDVVVLVPPHVVVSFDIELLEYLVESGLRVLISEVNFVGIHGFREFPALLVDYLGLLFTKHAKTIYKLKPIIKIDGLLDSDSMVS